MDQVSYYTAKTTFFGFLFHSLTNSISISLISLCHIFKRFELGFFLMIIDFQRMMLCIDLFTFFTEFACFFFYRSKCFIIFTDLFIDGIEFFDTGLDLFLNIRLVWFTGQQFRIQLCPLYIRLFEHRIITFFISAYRGTAIQEIDHCALIFFDLSVKLKYFLIKSSQFIAYRIKSLRTGSDPCICFLFCFPCFFQFCSKTFLFFLKVSYSASEMFITCLNSIDLFWKDIDLSFDLTFQ